MYGMKALNRVEINPYKQVNASGKGSVDADLSNFSSTLWAIGKRPRPLPTFPKDTTSCSDKGLLDFVKIRGSQVFGHFDATSLCKSFG